MFSSPTSSSRSSSSSGNVVVDETVDQPPPLRIAGLQSGATTILRDGIRGTRRGRARRGVRISELFFTEMGCNEAEYDYLDRFGITTSWSLEGSDLVLEGWTER